MRDIVYSKYSNDRAKEFQIVTDIVRDDDGTQRVIKRPYTEDARVHVNRIVENGKMLREQLRGTEIEAVDAQECAEGVTIPWVDGEPFSIYLDKLLTDGKEDEWRNKVNEYFSNLFKNSRRGFVRTKEFNMVFGDASVDEGEESISNIDIDMIFSNVIYKDDKWVAYDYEWVFSFDIPVKYMIYRCLSYYCSTQGKIGMATEDFYRGFCISSEQRESFDEMERNFQDYVRGNREPLWKLYMDIHGDVVNANIIHENYLQCRGRQVYYDYGDGYSEANSKRVTSNQYELNQYHVILEVPAGVRQMRYDPATYACRMVVNSVTDQDGNTLPYTVNGYPLSEDAYLCMSNDPQINIGLLETSKTVEIDYGMRLMGENDPGILTDANEILKKLEQEKTDLAHQVVAQKADYERKLADEEAGFRSQLEERDYRLQLMEHTISWRITKPLRWMTELFRRTRARLAIRTRIRGLAHSVCYGLSRIYNTIFDRENRREEQANSTNAVVSVVVPLYNTPEPYLRDMIESVLKQTYPAWQLCLVDCSDKSHVYVEKVCRSYAKGEGRILYRRQFQNKGIAENTNACIRMASGKYIALLDHDDVLHPDALRECVTALENGRDFVYTDELTFRDDNLENVVVRHYKPDFSPETLRGVNYICHLSVFKKDLLDKTGLLDSRYDGSQDHDLILKLTTVASSVGHIPRILYYWRMHGQSVSQDINAKGYAIDAGRRAVHDNEARLGRNVRVRSSEICPTHYCLDYEIMGNPKVSILVLGKKDLVDRAMTSVHDNISYGNCEIIADCDWDHAAQRASGEYLAFWNPYMEATNRDWVQKLLMYVQQDGIGIVTGRLVGADNRVLEAGYITGLDDERMVIPIGDGESIGEPGYIGRNYYAHDVNACSLYGAMIRADDYSKIPKEMLQGLVSGRYRGLCACNYLRRQGMRVVVNPYVLYYCSQEEIVMEEASLARCRIGHWEDPYYNRNLSRDGKWGTEVG